MLTLGVPLTPDEELFGRLAARVWASGRVTNAGPLNAELEGALAEMVGVSHVRAVSSGTAALTVALLALDLPVGSTVITTPLSFIATPLAIEAAGLRPAFAAIDPVTLNLDPDAVAAAITPDVSAILPVHLFGVPCDDRLDEVAASAGLPVVYDAAHAFGVGGAELAGRGAATCFSLHATKLLHTGEGGFVATRDAALDRRIVTARNFGLQGQVPAGRGTNAKLSEIAAATGLAALPRVDAERDARRDVRMTYDRELFNGSRVTPHVAASDALLFYLVRCRPEDQHDLLQRLVARGVIGRAFPALCDEGTRFADAALHGMARATARTIARTGIALPLHSGVTEQHVLAIADALT